MYMYLCIMVPYICKLYIRMQHNYCNKSVCNTIIAIFANYIHCIRMQHNYCNICKLFIRMQHNYCNICKLYIRMQHKYCNICKLFIRMQHNYCNNCKLYIKMQHNYIDIRLRFEKIDLWGTDGGAKCWSRRVKMARNDVFERRKMLHEARSKNRWRV